MSTAGPASTRQHGPATIPHLYVHVPFCPTICPFCSFHVLRRRDDLVEAYLHRLDVELVAMAKAWPGNGPLDTVYLGGGTPSHLSDAELERLTRSIRRHLDVAADAEWTLEAHPANVAPDRPPRWRDLGFTRVSVGVQSTQDPVLRTLGRGHDAATGLAALDAVLSVGGWSVNADLITVVPGQDLELDLRRLASSGAHHVAAYTLTIEPGTPFERRGISVDEEAQREALLAAGEILGAAGLARYEVSNHARAGHRCRHNLGYWENRFWFGVGPSATAHLPGPSPAAPADGASLVRNANLDSWLRGARPSSEVIEAADRARQLVMAGLRLVDGFELRGLDHPAPTAAAATELSELLGRIGKLCGEGLLINEHGRLRASNEGLLVLDTVLARIW